MKSRIYSKSSHSLRYRRKQLYDAIWEVEVEVEEQRSRNERLGQSIERRTRKNNTVLARAYTGSPNPEKSSGEEVLVPSEWSGISFIIIIVTIRKSSFSIKPKVSEPKSAFLFFSNWDYKVLWITNTAVGGWATSCSSISWIIRSVVNCWRMAQNWSGL